MHLTNFTNAQDADKVIFEDSSETLHRAWAFYGSDDDEAYLFFVDTSSGDIIDAYDQIFEGSVSGTVSGYATPCVSLDPALVDPACELCCPGDNSLTTFGDSPDTCGRFVVNP